MRRWELAVPLDSSAETPIFLQIARAIAGDVRRGRLRPGDALPGSRSLATTLGVHRNTILAAYRELSSEGWIDSAREGKAGTFVTDALPDPSPRRFSKEVAARVEVPNRVGFDLRPTHESWESPPIRKKGTIVLASGLPDLRLLPTTPLARAIRRVLRTHGREVLDYGDPRGHRTLRVALSSMLSSLRGLAADESSLVITRGSQHALDLVARAIIGPGDAVAVESLGYRPAWAALKNAGARLVPIPIDASGLDVDALEAAIDREAIRAIYTTPHHQYPTTIVMPPGRRLKLLELARARRIPIIEDDYDYEFHYEGRPVLPLASVDRAGVVIYIGTLSKILAPGLRLGFLVAPAPLIERVAALRAYVDRQGDQVIERAVAELIDEGEVQRHVRKMRNAYHARRDALSSALERELSGAVSFSTPLGGMALWVHAHDIDVEAWLAQCVDDGVAFHSGRRFSFDGRPRPFARLGYASATEAELREAVKRMAVAHRTVRRSIKSDRARTA